METDESSDIMDDCKMNKMATSKMRRATGGRKCTLDGKLNVIAGLTVLTLSVVARLTSAVMNLPDGIENILGFVPKSTFQCERDGYFGDIDNDCRIFHLCQRQVHPNGRTVSVLFQLHYTISARVHL